MSRRRNTAITITGLGFALTISACTNAQGSHLVSASTTLPAPSRTGKGLPLARPPLLPVSPSPTKVIVLATNRSGSFTWKLKAKVNPSAKTPGPGTADYGFYSLRDNLCVGVSLAFEGSVRCNSFSGTPSLVWASEGPPDNTTDPRSLPPGKAIVYGATSAAAARITVTFTSTSRAVTVATVHTPAIQGLRFFSALVPSGREMTVEAIAADGKPIERGHTGLS